MRRSLSFVALTAGATVLVVLAAGLPASAVTDTTPPTLTLRTPYAPFVIGGQDQFDDYGDGAVYNNAPERFAWAASDASGICGSRVWAYIAEGADELVDFDNPSLREFTGTGTDYDGSFGGGSQIIEGWWVTAVDCAGNETVLPESGAATRFTQDDGTESSYGPRDVALEYSPDDWGTSRCTCWSGGTVHRTSTAGASAKITMSVADPGQRVALIMEKAPNRGKFKVYVDGAYRSTVDTYAASPRHRIIVWQTAFNSTGKHTVRLVNLATPGRPRIDLDVVASDVPGSLDPAPHCGDEDFTICGGDSNGPTTAWSASPVLGASLSDAGATPTLLSKVGWTIADASGLGYAIVTKADAASSGIGQTIWRSTGGASASSTYSWRPVVRDVTNDPTFFDNSVYFTAQSTDPSGKFGFAEVDFGPEIFQQNDSHVSYSSGWSPSSCTCWSGGTLTKSSTPGATATFSFNSGVVSYIGDRASDRGTADIYLDGVFKKHVSLTSSTKSFRTVLYHSGYLDWGNHTITVKVVSGRVDVDGFVVS